ncbi:hypothetical protein IWX46DRAFT_418912 [Phyllosticta citricarpa]|uniref:Uncharacterized protein n=1 Tax=Phyllosticta citricarpa TaxID=55181 RepID=A0ABR1MIT9_9PEZI
MVEGGLGAMRVGAGRRYPGLNWDVGLGRWHSDADVAQVFWCAAWQTHTVVSQGKGMSSVASSNDRKQASSTSVVAYLGLLSRSQVAKSPPYSCQESLEKVCWDGGCQVSAGRSKDVAPGRSKERASCDGFACRGPRSCVPGLLFFFFFFFFFSFSFLTWCSPHLACGPWLCARCAALVAARWWWPLLSLLQSQRSVGFFSSLLRVGRSGCRV